MSHDNAENPGNALRTIQPPEITILDPDGDLCLLLREDGSLTKSELQVCSRTLSRSCIFFKTMFNSRFLERKPLQGAWEINIEVDNTIAAIRVLRYIHSPSRVLLKGLALDELFQVVRAILYFGCESHFEPIVPSIWHSQIHREVMGITKKNVNTFGRHAPMICALRNGSAQDLLHIAFHLGCEHSALLLLRTLQESMKALRDYVQYDAFDSELLGWKGAAQLAKLVRARGGLSALFKPGFADFEFVAAANKRLDAIRAIEIKTQESLFECFIIALRDDLPRFDATHGMKRAALDSDAPLTSDEARDDACHHQVRSRLAEKINKDGLRPPHYLIAERYRSQMPASCYSMLVRLLCEENKRCRVCVPLRKSLMDILERDAEEIRTYSMFELTDAQTRMIETKRELFGM